MSKRIIIIALILFIAIFVNTENVSAETLAVCCAPTPHTYSAGEVCPAGKYQEINSASDAFKTPEELCRVVATTPTTNIVNCQSNRDPVKNLDGRVVKGSRNIQLSWTSTCQPLKFELKRFKIDSNGVPESQPSKTVTVPRGVTAYTDTGLTFQKVGDTKYEFRVTAIYAGTQNNEVSSTTEKKVVSLGNIECLGRGTETFCINPSFYTQSSLQSETPASFSDRVRKAFQCPGDDNNLKNIPINPSCTPQQLCVIDDSRSPVCSIDGECEQEDFFGLFTTKNSCLKNSQGVPKSCFYDKSETLLNKCYSCSSTMKCYDYKTRDACSTDSCQVGGRPPRCSWNDVAGLGFLGIGVCVEKDADNCLFCGTKRTALDAPNEEAFNDIFDVCTEPLSNALSLSGVQCLYTDGGTASCNDWSCTNFTQLGSSPTDIKQKCIGGANPSVPSLDISNNIVGRSDNACGIPVCRYDSGSVKSKSCFKDADGDGARDCNFFNDDGTENVQKNSDCEKDYFSPNVSITRSPSRDKLLIELYDKKLKLFDEEPVEIDSYDVDDPLYPGCPETFKESTTSICVLNPVDNSCNYKNTRCNYVYIYDDKIIFEDNSTLQLETGVNTLKFFSTDWAKNKGVVQETFVVGCKGCENASLKNFVVSPAIRVENVDVLPEYGLWYTNKKNAVLSLRFLELPNKIVPSIVLFEANILNASDPSLKELYKYSVSGESRYTHSFNLLDANLPDGEYILSFKGQDSLYGKPIQKDAELKFILDTTPPNLTNSDSIYSDGGSASLIFDEFVYLKNVSLSWKGHTGLVAKCGIAFDVVNISSSTNPMFLSTDDPANTSWSSVVDDGSSIDGIRWLNVSITDKANNSAFFKLNFTIEKVGPIMAVIAPPYCVTDKQIFTLQVQTLQPVESCVYYTDSVDEDATLAGYDNIPGLTRKSDSLFETILDFQKITGKKLFKGETKDIAIACRNIAKNIVTTQRFKLRFFDGPPKIVKVFAHPSPITEPTIINRVPVYNTSLNVQTTDETFCKYDSSVSVYESMDGEFFGWLLEPRISHTEEYIVDRDHQSYNVNIQCTNPSQTSKSDLKNIAFKVETNIDLNFSFVAPVQNSFINIASPRVSVITNKGALCYHSLDNSPLVMFSSDDSLGPGETSYDHWDEFSDIVDGNHTVIVECRKPGFSQIARNSRKFTIDTTSPLINSVNISSSPNKTGTYFDKSRLIVRVSGFDNGSGISRMFYKLEDDSSNIVVDCSPEKFASGRCVHSQEFNKEWVFNTDHNGKNINLTNGDSYKVTAWLQDKTGLQSSPLTSSPIKIDIASIPQLCRNGLQDVGESGVDCGGQCGACSINQSCIQQRDCSGGLSCTNNTCSGASCTNGKKDGLESGVDCGGSCSNQCDLGGGCISTTDCNTNLVCLNTGTCEIPGPCENNERDPGEPDVDCGTMCSKKCDLFQSCFQKEDCSDGLECTSGSCSTTDRPIDDTGGFDDDDWSVDGDDGDSGVSGSSIVGGKGKSILLWIIILLVLVAGGWYLYTNFSGKHVKKSPQLFSRPSFIPKIRMPLGKQQPVNRPTTSGSPLTSQRSSFVQRQVAPQKVQQAKISQVNTQNQQIVKKLESQKQESKQLSALEKLRSLKTFSKNDESKFVKDDYVELGQSKKKSKSSGLSALREVAKK